MCLLQWRNRSARRTYRQLMVQDMRRLWVQTSPGALFGSQKRFFTYNVLQPVIRYVRMAEWSKAPDSRIVPSPNRWWEHSGPRMWAWVRIPLLTAFYFLFVFVIRIDQKSASAGNRTPINCLEGNYASHYTTNAYELKVFLCLSGLIWRQLQVTTKLRQQGIEPRSTAWKATMLTITPLTPVDRRANSNELVIS